MILGIGIDLCEISRIKKAYKRFGDRFLSRICSEKELEFLSTVPHFLQGLASSFAVKEAAAKALGTGIGLISWRDINVGRCSNGAPFLSFYGEAFKRSLVLLGDQKGRVIPFVSVSYAENIVSACVVLDCLLEN